MTTRRVYSNILKAANQSFGQACADKPKPRNFSPHNRIQPHVSARCLAGDCGHCTSLHCVCDKCKHMGGVGR
jgi:hypothetical protein